MTNFNKAKDNYFDLLNSDVSDEKYENTLVSMEDYLHNCMTTHDGSGEIKYTYCPTSMLKDIYNLSDDEIFSLVLELGYHICQLFGDCEYEVQDYFIVKDEDSVNQLVSDFENYLDFTPSYEIIPSVAYEECLKESKNKERPTKNQLKDWAKKHKKTNKKNAWGWWIFSNVEDGIKFFNHVMGSNSSDGAEISGSSTEVSGTDSMSAGVGESLTEDDTLRTPYSLTKEQLQKVKDVLKNNLNKLLEDNDVVISNSLPHGPSFILRDGRFVDVVESGKNFKNTYLGNEIVTHLNFLRNLISIVIDDYYNVRVTYSIMEDLAAYVTDFLGVLRCNTGETDEEDRYYCVLPGRYLGAARPTNVQYSSLLQFLDYGVDNARDNEVLVFCGDADEYSKSETFNCKTPDNTLSAIKNFYRTGVLAEAVKFSNNALERMSKFVDSVKESKNLQLLNNQDTPICYESAVNNVFYFHRLGKDCILHLGTFDETGNTIVHAWVECEGKIYQTAEPKNKPKNYKLKSLKQIEISKDMSEDDIEKAIKSSYEKSESLKEAKEDIEKFINKFGQDIYDLFIKSKDRLKNNNISTDILYHVKNTSVEDMKNILHNLQSKVKSDDLTKIQGKYNYLGEVDGYKVYQPLDVIASMNLGVGSGWCTTGRYGHYGEVNFKPSLEDAESHWNDYVVHAGIEFFYLLDAKTMLAKYAIALYPEMFEVDELVDNLLISNANFEIFNAEDYTDYAAYFKLKNVTKLISEYSSYSELILDAVDMDESYVLDEKSIYNDVVFEKDINRKFKHLIIPQGVETIDNMAFAYSKLLESIELPNTLVNIGAYAFYECINLKNIEFPDSVTYMNIYAFGGCKSLTDVVLPKNLSDIPDGLFCKCTNLRSVKIPKNIDSIGYSAFSECANLKSIVIPRSVIAVGDYAFAECSNLTIYCEMESKPDNWGKLWNPTNCPVVWNYKEGMNESLEEDVEIHDTLNSKFWEDNELKAEVREKIEAIVERFKTYLNDKNIKIDVKDILLLGSNASYNYTDDSDLDIHIIVEPKEITEDEELLKQLYDLAASAFNDKFNITLKNSDAEVYVELNDTDAHSNGIYSLEKGWIKEPVKDELKNVELDKEELNKWKKRYQDVLEEKDAKKIKKFIAELYKLRKDSIAADGEYSQGNLIFKEMRNLGYISKLKELLDEIESKELSLETLTEAKEDIEKFVNKFGQDVYDWFIKSKDRLKNNKISTDILYHVKNTSVEDMKTILLVLT